MAKKKISLGPKKPNLSQLSSIGIPYSGGMFFDSTIRALNGPRSFDAYREMADHSAVIGACLFAIEMLIRKVRWTVEPGDATNEEQERAKIIETMIDDMSISWQDTITEVLSMLVYGWAYMEEVYKIRRGPNESDGRYRSRYSDGLVGWRKWVLVPQETLHSWDWDDDGGLQGLNQLGPPDYRQRHIPIQKALLFRTKSARNNPQGRSMLLNAFFAWESAKRAMEWELIGLERDLAGIPYAGVPPEYMDPSASDEDRAFLEGVKSLITGLRQNDQAGVIFPKSSDEHNNELFEFKLLATGGMKQFDTNKIIERYERRMAMSMLSDVILMGHEKVGSLALSRDKTTLIGRALAGILGSIQAVINMHAVPRIYKLNGWVPENPAKLVPGTVENADIKNLGGYIRNLMSVGALTPDPKLEAALREAGDLPMIDPEFELGPDELKQIHGVMPPEPKDPMDGPDNEIDNHDGPADQNNVDS